MPPATRPGLDHLCPRTDCTKKLDGWELPVLLGPGKDVFERELQTIEVVNVPEGHATDVLMPTAIRAASSGLR